jgi:hypothetical protein
MGHPSSAGFVRGAFIALGLSTVLSIAAVISGLASLFFALFAGISGFTVAIIALAFAVSGSTGSGRAASGQGRKDAGGDSDTGVLVSVGGLSDGGKRSGVGSLEAGEASGGSHAEGGDGGGGGGGGD